VEFNGNPINWNTAKREIRQLLHSAHALQAIEDDPPTFFANLTPPPMPVKPVLLPQSSLGPSTRQVAEASSVATEAHQEALRDYEKDMIRHNESLMELDRRMADRERRRAAWDIMDSAAFKILKETIGKTVQADLKDAYDSLNAKTIWKALEEKYSIAPTARVSKVYTSITSIVLQNEESVSQYCVRLEDNFSTLISRGETVSNDFKLAFLINGIEISKRSEEFSFILKFTETSNYDYNQTREAILEDDRKRVKKGKSVDVNKAAVQKSGKKNGSDKADKSTKFEKSPFKCMFCRNNDHFTNYCKGFLDTLENKGSADAKLTDSTTAKASDKKPKVNIGHVLVQSTIQDSGDSFDVIGLDTCAGKHITGDISLLKGISTSNNIIVKAYDGSIRDTTLIGNIGKFGEAVHVEGIHSNLLSFNQLLDEGFFY